MKSMDCVCCTVFCLSEGILVGSESGKVRAHLLRGAPPFQERGRLEKTIAIQSFSKLYAVLSRER